MANRLTVQQPQTQHIGTSSSTPTQEAEGQDGGRKVSSLIKKFEATAGETSTTKGPSTDKKPQSLPKQRTVEPHTSTVKRQVVVKSKGPTTQPQTTPKKTETAYNYKEYVQKFGSKTANLYEIENLGVKVPERSPISSDDVLAHLLKKDTDGVIDASWTAMQKNGKVDDVNLKAITDTIAKIFDDSDFPFTEEQIGWINKTMAGKVIIARSTGDEDSADTPNAGGNESVLFVEPTVASVKDAMKEVVLSYFGADSLRNRIVGDGVDKVLAGLPKMPVLLMEMIAEPIKDSSKVDNGDPPPIGIAMSTDKLEFTGGEGFHFVSITSAVGPGVNEGSGQIAIDETYVMQSKDGTPLLIYQKPSVKTDRVRAVKEEDGSITNMLQKNSTQLAYSPSLSRDKVRSLVTSSDKIKTLNDGKTTEVEAVVGGDGTINFVQHRAIPDQRSKIDPTYVEVKEANGHSKAFQYTTVVPKSGDALVITDWSQVCFAETMKEAEAMFDWKGGSQKVVIVRHPDGSNSHPAVNFGSYKKEVNGNKEPNPIPCLVVPNFDELIAQKKSALGDKQPLIVDGQSQKVFVWTGKTFDSNATISKGRISHHIGLDTSVSDGEVLELVNKLKTTTSDQVRSIKNELDPVLEKYEKELARYDELLTKNADTIHNSDGLKLRLKTVQENFTEVKAALTKVVQGNSKYTFEPGTHARLLLVKFFESSMHDIDHFNQLIEAEKSASLYVKSAKVASLGKTVFADEVKAVDHALTGPLSLRWKRFLTLAEQAKLSDSQISDFKAMMTGLEKLGVTANWMSMVFDKKYAEIMPTQRTGSTPAAPAAKRLLEALVSDYAATSDFLAANQALQKSIGEIEHGIADFATPSKFAKAFDELKAVAKPFIDNDWPDDLNDNPLKKSVQAQTLGRLIEVFDGSIKKLKSSPLETGKLVATEVEMLDSFFELFESLFAKIDMPGQNNDLTAKAKYIDQLKTAFKLLKAGIPSMDRQTLENQSRCGSAFNVGMCLYSTGAKENPKTVEEVFTTIHQGLEEIRSGLMVGGSDFGIDIPVKMHGLLAGVPRLAMQTVVHAPGKLVGTNISSTGVSYTYNMPIRDHGIKVTASYEKPKVEGAEGRVFLELDFYADNANSRLENLAKLARQYRFGSESLDDSSRREVTWGEKQLKTRFEIRDPMDIKRLEGLVNYMNLYSMTSDSTRPKPQHVLMLSYIVGSSADFTSGKYPVKRKEALKDFLNVALGGVEGAFDDEGKIKTASTNYNVQLAPSKAFTFHDKTDGKTYALDVEKPLFGLSKDVFDQLPEDLLGELKQEVLRGTQQFTFDYHGRTYALDLNKDDLGLSARDLKALSLKAEFLSDLKDELKLAWDGANFYLPSKDAASFRLPWADFMYGTPMAYSGKKKFPELELWKQVSVKKNARRDLATIDGAFPKVLEKKYALHNLDKTLERSGGQLSPQERNALGKSLQDYYAELSKFELTCMGYVGKKKTEGKFTNANAHGQVKDLKELTAIQKRSIEHRMQLLGFTPEGLSNKQVAALSFREHVGAW